MRTWVAAGSIALAWAAGCGAPQPRLIDAPGPLVVASDLDNPPFAWVDDAGTPRGRDVEMMELLARGLGRALEWRRMPFDQLLGAVEAGRVDVCCATLGVTEERAQRVAFTRPYFETVLAVVVRAGAGEPSSLAELAGRRVAAGAGTTSERAVRSALPRAVGVYEQKSGRTTAERLLAGEIDAAVLDGPAAEALVAASGEQLALLDENLGAERYALALPLGRTELLASLNRALASLEGFGFLANLDREHGLR